MDIIDFHTHLWPDKIAEKAKEYLEKSFKMPMTAVPVEKNVLKEMDENGITKSVIASVASRPDQVEHINNWLFRLNPERFIKFASLHPFYEKWSYELDRIKDNAQGIKIQPEFQMFYIDDERVFPMYEKIQKLQIPLLFHCGYELSTGLIQAGPKQMLNVKKHFPGITFVAAHMGGFKIWDEVEKNIIGDDYFYIDTSSSLSFMKEEQFYRFLNKHNKDKIVFGTDFPVGNPKKEIELINNLNIDKEFKEKIFHLNAEKILNLK
ncbi:MAG: amidohydrolase family protein [Elusimicrobia bacterium]|nr:amidohydrolase family protein [Elusimicrobiota bacterium]